MSLTDDWSVPPRLVCHIYWQSKRQFQLQVDTYPDSVLFAVEEGSFRYRIGNNGGVAGPGELVYCAPNCPFERETVTPLTFHFLEFEIPSALNAAGAVPVHIRPQDTKRLQSDYAYLRKLHLANDTYSTVRKQWMLGDIWQLVSDESVSGMRASRDTFQEWSMSDDELMNEAAKWLLGRAYTRFGMRELSSLLALSPVQFTRRFRRAFHMLPSDMVRTLRIRRAAGLLLDSELTLDQIAERCGYENGFYLSRVFTTSMNITPSKYRERYRV